MSKALNIVMVFNGQRQLRHDFWRRTVAGNASQEDVKLDTVICANDVSEGDRDFLQGLANEGLCDVLIVDQRYSVNLLWGFAAGLYRGKYDWYGFQTSGTYFLNNKDFSVLLNDAETSDRCGAISPQFNLDMNLKWADLCGHGDSPTTRVQVGRGTNGHYHLFSKALLEKFDYRRMDRLFGSRTEPFIAYCCASVRLSEYVSHKVLMHHDVSKERFPFEESDYPIGMSYDRFMDLMREGSKIGLGFEELYMDDPKTVRHNPDAFEDGYAKTDELYRFLVDKVFLQKSEFDYSSIQYAHIARKTRLS